MSIQYTRGKLSFDQTLYDASLNNDGLIIRVSKTDNVAPQILADKFALSCIVQGDGVSYMNTGTVAVPVWGIISTDGSITTSGILTSSQILSLVSSPTTVVPAGGVGFAYFVTSWKFKFIPGSTPYTINGPAFLRINNSAGTTIFAQVQQSGFLNSLSEITRYNEVGGIVGFILDDNTGLVIEGTSADPTLGDGTLEYEIKYKIITL